MNSDRLAGYAGSSGTYAPPAFQTPSSAGTSHSSRSRQTPTSEPRPTPSRRSSRATAPARRWSSAYVSRTAPAITAIPSGTRPAVSSIAR